MQKQPNQLQEHAFAATHQSFDQEEQYEYEKQISVDAYLEQPNVEVVGLNEWERLHLGEQMSDSDEDI